MDAEKILPRISDKGYNLTSIIFFVIVVVLMVVFLSGLCYIWFLRPATQYASLLPVFPRIPAIG